MLCAIFDLIVLAFQQLFQLADVVLGVFPGLLPFVFDPLLQTLSSYGCQL